MRPVAMTPAIGPRVPMYPPATPGLGQQIFYGQPPHALIPPQVQCFLKHFALALSLIFYLLCIH